MPRSINDTIHYNTLQYIAIHYNYNVKYPDLVPESWTQNLNYCEPVQDMGSNVSLGSHGPTWQLQLVANITLCKHSRIEWGALGQREDSISARDMSLSQ